MRSITLSLWRRTYLLANDLANKKAGAFIIELFDCFAVVADDDLCRLQSFTHVSAIGLHTRGSLAAAHYHSIVSDALRDYNQTLKMRSHLRFSGV